MEEKIHNLGKQVMTLAGLSMILLLTVVQAITGQPAVYPYRSFPEFRKDVGCMSNIADPAERDKQVNSLFDKLKSDNQIPFRLGDSVAFLYRGEAKAVSWAGDFNKWQPAQTGYVGTRPGQANIWMAIQKFPVDARLDYKIVVDDKWILDPDNPNIQMSGMGPNSELHMPGWKFPDDTELSPDVIRGNLSDNILITSEKLGYQINYKVYTPYNYARSESLPVIYVTDGHEYADDPKGSMLVILDNLKLLKAKIRYYYL